MKDPIATGSFFSGHGRGMSQQGSWWWAEGLAFLGDPTPPAGWQCILDHYYNDNGNSTGAGGELTYRYSFLYGPGGDGQIAYAPISAIPSRMGYPGSGSSCGTDIFTMRLDGSNLADITPNQCNGEPAWAPNQLLIVYTALPLAVSIVNADGNGTPTYLEFGAMPDWSRENAIVYYWPQGGLYSVNPDGSSLFPITSDPWAGDPFWSPDGTKVAYDTTQNGLQIAVMNANGSGQPTFLTSGSNNIEPAWSPDGNYIAFISDRSASGEIWLMNADGSGIPTQLTFSSPYPNAFPRWSQDGHYIVWLSVLDVANMLNIMDAPSGQNQYSYGLGLAPGALPKINTTRCRRFDAL